MAAYETGFLTPFVHDELSGDWFAPDNIYDEDDATFDSFGVTASEGVNVVALYFQELASMPEGFVLTSMEFRHRHNHFNAGLVYDIRLKNGTTGLSVATTSITEAATGVGGPVTETTDIVDWQSPIDEIDISDPDFNVWVNPFSTGVASARFHEWSFNFKGTVPDPPVSSGMNAWWKNRLC